MAQRRNPRSNKNFQELNESENTTQPLRHSESGPGKEIHNSKNLKSECTQINDLMVKLKIWRNKNKLNPNPVNSNKEKENVSRN